MAGSKVKRGKNSWLLSYYEGIDPKTGKKKYYRETFKVPDGASAKESEKLADLRLAEIITDKNRQEFIDPSKLTYYQYLKTIWLPAIKVDITTATYEDYECTVEKHIANDLIAKIPLTKLELQHIEGYKIRKLNSLRLDGKAKLSPKTVKNHLIAIKASLTYACKLRILKYNPAQYAEFPKVNKYKPQTWTEDEAARFLEAAFYDRFYFLYLLAIYYSKRMGELRGLRRIDVDTKALIASVRQSVHGNGNKAEFKPTKSEEEYTLELEPWMVEYFEREFTERKKERLEYGPGYNENGLVFASVNGNPVKERHLRERFYSVIERAKVPKIRFHDLRHTCITIMLKRGWSLKHAQVRAAHADIRTTGNIYSHVTPTMQREVNEDMTKALKIYIPQKGKGIK